MLNHVRLLVSFSLLLFGLLALPINILPTEKFDVLAQGDPYQQGALVKGHVTLDSGNGPEAVPRATVKIYTSETTSNEEPLWETMTQTDEQGFYELVIPDNVVLPADFYIKAYAPESMPDVDPSEKMKVNIGVEGLILDLELDADDTDPLVCHYPEDEGKEGCQPGDRSIEGTAFDMEQNPVKGLEIKAKPVQETRQMVDWVGMTLTDESGKYKLPLPDFDPPIDNFMVEAYWPDAGRAFEQMITFAPNQNEISLNISVDDNGGGDICDPEHPEYDPEDPRCMGDGITITGKILFPDDSPVSDVEVQLFIPSEEEPEESLVSALDDHREPDQIWWARTNRNGEFMFEAPDKDNYVLEFFLPPSLRDWTPPAPVELMGKAGFVGEFYLAEANFSKTIQGEVLYEMDDTVNRVPDVEVYAFNDESGQRHEAKSNDEGKFKFRVAPGEWQIGVDVKPSEGWHFEPQNEARVEFEDNDELVTETVEVWVQKVADDGFFEVSGTIVTGDGGSLPEDISVELCSEEDGCFEGEVAQDGTFSIVVPPDAYELSVDVPRESGYLPTQFRIFVDKDKNVEIELNSGSNRSATLKGQVIISDTQTGLEDAMVEAWSVDYPDWSETETDDDGRFELSVLPGEWGAKVSLPDELADKYQVLPPEDLHGKIRDNQSLDINFYVQEIDGVISGTVTLSDGTLLPNDVTAYVYALSCKQRRDNGPNAQQTDEDKSIEACRWVNDSPVYNGWFELNLVDGNYRLGVIVEDESYQPGKEVETTVPSNGPVQLMVNQSNTKITGQFYLVDDMSRQREPVYVSASVFARDDSGNWAEDDIHTTDELTKTTYTLHVTENTTWTLGYEVDPASGYVPAYDMFNEADVAVGTENVTINLPIRRLGMGDDGITGKVVDTTGAPVPYVEVVAEGEEKDFFTETDQNGEFSLSVLVFDEEEKNEYDLKVYLNPDLRDAGYLPPKPYHWAGPQDNPVELKLRKGMSGGSGGLAISGALSGDGVADDVTIEIFAHSIDGVRRYVTGTTASGYNLPVYSNTTWFLWASYEDSDNGTFYFSEEISVTVESENVTGQDLALAQANWDFPDTECQDFETDRATRFELPGRGDILAPLIEISAGAIPVTGTATICAQPLGSVPGGQDVVGLAYEMSIRDSSGNLVEDNFNQSLRVMFYFTQDLLNNLPGQPTANDLQVQFYSESKEEWVELEDVYVDASDGFVTGKISHFSRMGARSVLADSETDTTDTTISVYLPSIMK